MAIELELLAGELAVCRLPPDAPLPDWARGGFTSLTRTAEELSVVCAAERVPAAVACERGWQALRVAGRLDFAMTGVLASLTVPLATAGVSVFVLSTFDTDYLLVRQTSLSAAAAALAAAGLKIRGDSG